MVRSPLRSWSTWAGVVAGVIAAVALVASGTLRMPPHREEANAQPDFLDAWSRSRSGTFVVQSEFRRTKADGSTLYSASELVQRPPDRLVREFGGITGKVGGHSLNCATDPSGNYRCFAGEESLPPFEEQMADEVGILRDYFTGDHPIYKVVRSEPGCFELFLQQPYPDPDYGQYARFCFDQPTGALRLLERHLSGGVVETVEAVSIRTDVRDDDFSTEADPDYGLRMDLAGLADPGVPVQPAPVDTTPAESPLGTSGPTGTAPR